MNSLQDPFNKDRLFNYVKTFSFPRLSGTEGEQKAVELTIKNFKDIGYKDDQIIREPFQFSDFYSTTLVQLIMIMCLTFYLILLVVAYIDTIIAIIFITMIAIIVILIIRGLKHPETGFWGEYFGKTYSSTNVFVKIPAKKNNPGNVGDLIISAHLDSKSQSFKTAWRIVLYRIWLFGSVLLGSLYIAYIILGFFLYNLRNFNLVFQIFIWSSTALVSFSNIMLLFLTTHNKSPGSLDNATGMAIVFELSSYFRDNPLENFNLWFCQFSAEELGTMGSRIFVNAREENFKKGKIFQINLDMISSAKHSAKKNNVGYLKSYGIFPRRNISPLLGKFLDKAAMEEKLLIDGFHLSTGAHTDSVPFHLRGYDAVDITTRSAALYTHDITDTPDKVDPQILSDACKIVYRTIFNLDKDFKILSDIKTAINNDK
ncbi:MAG: M28 family metallopeptidase [Promethearchaeota archaeon]